MVSLYWETYTGESVQQRALMFQAGGRGGCDVDQEEEADGDHRFIGRGGSR